MAKYKIGTSEDTWNFLEAYYDAQDGDTLEFESGYRFIYPENQEFEISKNLNIVGNISKNDEGTVSFSNVIKGKFKVKDSVTLTIQNMWIDEVDNYYSFVVTQSSTLNLKNCYFNHVSDDGAVGFVKLSDKSTAQIEEVIINNKGEAPCYISCSDGASVEILNSTKLYASLIGESLATIVVKNSKVASKYGNVIKLNNANLVLNSSHLQSELLTDENYPAIHATSSIIVSEDSSVKQQSIYLLENSTLRSTDNQYESLMLQNSKAHLEKDTIERWLTADESSYIKSKDQLEFLGLDKERVDFSVLENSTFISETIQLRRTFDPNIRVQNGSFCYIDALETNNNDFKTDVDETSRFVDGGNHVRADVGEDALTTINNLVGLKQVKQTIETMINQVEANRKRIEKGLQPMEQTLNSVFLGNPGTGKTTVARLLGKALFQHGVLKGKEFRFIEVSEADLIAAHIGGTAIQTKKYLDEARGGILFIDEAYTLHKKDGSNFGQEAINTIMKYMEDYRNEIMIIFAGYTKEMEEFLNSNPGLVSRVPNRFLFEDYTPNEIVQLGESLLEQDQFILEDKEYYSKQVGKAYQNSLDKSNGRWIRNFNELLTKEQFNRIVQTNSDDVVTIKNSDIDSVLNIGKSKQETGEEGDAFQTLEGLIGISNVKKQVREFIYLVEANRRKEEIGIKVPEFTLHSLFLGNPGTGKTTVARLLGKVLYQKGLITTNKFIEVSRSELVGGYIGHTAIKTKEVLNSALGGVLFIDEAYTLYSSSENDFGREAINEILKFMEDHRQDIVIIFAGYTKEMEEFLQMNSGLRSRIPTVFDFEDYSPEEIAQIGLLSLTDYQFDREVYANKVKHSYLITNDHSNGRWIRNFNEKLLRIQSYRLKKNGGQGLDTITNEDIKEVD